MATVSAPLNIDITAQNCPNNANFQGNYAFILDGGKSWAEVGSFVSDGAGNITSGFADNYLSYSPYVQPPTTLTGTYCIGPNNLGTLTLTDPASSTNTIAIAVQSDGNARIALFDSLPQGGDTFIEASGVALKQDPTAFSLSKIAGNYAFSLIGWHGLPRFERAGLLGAFSADRQGNLNNGELNGSHSFSANNLVVSSTGRGTVTLNFTTGLLGPSSNTVSLTFYIVNSSHLLAIASSTSAPDLCCLDHYSGDIVQQTGRPYTIASLSGVSVVETQASGTTGSTSTQAQVGLITWDGAGNFSLKADQNDGGALTAPAFTGTYSVSSNGRVNLSATGQPSPTTVILYLTDVNQAFVLGFTNTSFGTIEPQSGGPIFSTASFSGTISSTYSISANGGGVLTQDGSPSYIFYVVSPSKVVLLNTIANPYVTTLSH